jgi:enediyne biosynthesis protein E4
VKDVDGDGNLDAILGGNLYNSEAETPRNDASYGLWIKGDGNGEFDACLTKRIWTSHAW